VAGAGAPPAAGMSANGPPFAHDSEGVETTRARPARARSSREPDGRARMERMTHYPVFLKERPARSHPEIGATAVGVLRDRQFDTRRPPGPPTQGAAMPEIRIPSTPSAAAPRS
jgi:hypothetical protein